MKKIAVTAYVPLETALARGRSEYGDTIIELGDSDVAGLSDGARALLRLGALELVLRVEEPTSASACVALELRVIAEAEKKAEAEREREARIEKAVAASDDDWISLNTRFGSRPEFYGHGPVGIYLNGTEKTDPRIAARLERAKPRLELVQFAYEEAEALRKAEQARKDAEGEAAKEAYQFALRKVASTEDDLARAAAEGYPVEKAVLDRLVRRLSERVQALTDDRCWVNVTDKSAPNADAFALLDKVTAAVREENERLPAAIGQWKVSRVVRVDVCPHQNQRHFVTAVLATLDTSTTERQITWSTESFECHHDDVDD